MATPPEIAITAEELFNLDEIAFNNLKELVLKGNILNYIRLPPRLKKLNISHCAYHYDLPYLPNSLRALILPFGYDREINGLPPRLKKLDMSFCNYDYDLPYLPNSLRALILPFGYDREINGLPTSLKYICFEINYNPPLPIFPDSVRTIVFYRVTHENNNIEYMQIPLKLKKLYLGFNIISGLPELGNTRIKTLYLGGDLNKKIIKLPETLRSFYLGHTYSHALPDLPSGLRRLHLPGNLITLPPLSPSLKYIRFGHIYSRRLFGKDRLRLNGKYKLNSEELPYIKNIKIIKEHIDIWKYKNLIFNIKEDEYDYVIRKNLTPYMKYMIYNSKFIPYEIYNYIYFNYNFIYNN